MTDKDEKQCVAVTEEQYENSLNATVRVLSTFRGVKFLLLSSAGVSVFQASLSFAVDQMAGDTTNSQNRLLWQWGAVLTIFILFLIADYVLDLKYRKREERDRAALKASRTMNRHQTTKFTAIPNQDDDFSSS